MAEFGYVATPEPILQALHPIARYNAREDVYSDAMIRYLFHFQRRWRLAVEAYWDGREVKYGY